MLSPRVRAQLGLPATFSAAQVEWLLFELVFLTATVATALPAFATYHLPLQDLPQHMAAVSILGRYPLEPALRDYFELALAGTQYLLPYAAGVMLAPLVGVEHAMRIVLTLIILTLPYALRFAIRRTGGEERLAALAWPFAWNPQTMFGFLNFSMGFPLALLGIGLFADQRRRRTWRGTAELAVVAVLTFYCHLIPFGLLGLGVLLQLHPASAGRAGTVAAGLRDRIERTLVAWWTDLRFLAPSGLALLVYVLNSPARDASVRAGGTAAEVPLAWPDRDALPGEFKDTILRAIGGADETLLIVWGLALLFALGAAVSEATEVRPARRVAWLPFLCAVLYVLAPKSYGWIWPIHTRFAVGAVILLPLAFRKLHTPALGAMVAAALALPTVAFAGDLARSFIAWDREELGPLDDALAHAAPHRRLVALVPAAGSKHVAGNVPLLHAAAYYQVNGGDVATFSFADFPQSPFRYRDAGPRPPRLQPRWEWTSSLATADPEYAYYDYVLVRKGVKDEPGALSREYRRVYQNQAWKLYERLAPPN